MHVYRVQIIGSTSGPCPSTTANSCMRPSRPSGLQCLPMTESHPKSIDPRDLSTNQTICQWLMLDPLKKFAKAAPRGVGAGPSDFWCSERFRGGVQRPIEEAGGVETRIDLDRGRLPIPSITPIPCEHERGHLGPACGRRCGVPMAGWSLQVSSEPVGRDSSGIRRSIADAPDPQTSRRRWDAIKP